MLPIKKKNKKSKTCKHNIVFKYQNYGDGANWDGLKMTGKIKRPIIRVVIIDDRNRLLIFKRGSNAKSSVNLWELPSGKMENNENFKKATKRITEEKTGLCVKPDEGFFFSFTIEATPIGGTIKLDKNYTEFRWISRENWETLNYAPMVKTILTEFFRQKEEHLRFMLSLISLKCSNCGLNPYASSFDIFSNFIIRTCRKCGYIQFFDRTILEIKTEYPDKHPVKFLLRELLKGLEKLLKHIKDNKP